MKIYLIGSLRNPAIPKIGQRLRDETGYEIFDDWYSAGPDADDNLRDYERARGHTYREILDGHAAKNIFNFDRYHLQTSDAAVLVLPCGKSAHLEGGWMLGQGKPLAVLAMNEPERVEVMHQFTDFVALDIEELIGWFTRRLGLIL